MIFCQSASTVWVLSEVIGGGDTQTLTAVMKFVLFALRGIGDDKTLLLHFHALLRPGHLVRLLVSYIFSILLPPANVVCEGYVFTGVCLSTGGVSREGGTPQKEASPWQGVPPPPGRRHPPGMENPPEGGTPLARRPPGRRHPPARRPPPHPLEGGTPPEGGIPWQGDPPPQKKHPLEGGTPPARRPLEGGTPPPTATAAGGTHPTGMHSCIWLWTGPVWWTSVSRVNFKLNGDQTRTHPTEYFIFGDFGKNMGLAPPPQGWYWESLIPHYIDPW